MSTQITFFLQSRSSPEDQGENVIDVAPVAATSKLVFVFDHVVDTAMGYALSWMESTWNLSEANCGSSLPGRVPSTFKLVQQSWKTHFLLSFTSLYPHPTSNVTYAFMRAAMPSPKASRARTPRRKTPSCISAARPSGLASKVFKTGLEDVTPMPSHPQCGQRLSKEVR